jgi:hypothetical protein
VEGDKAHWDAEVGRPERLRIAVNELSRRADAAMERVRERARGGAPEDEILAAAEDAAKLYAMMLDAAKAAKRALDRLGGRVFDETEGRST